MKPSSTCPEHTGAGALIAESIKLIDKLNDLTSYDNAATWGFDCGKHIVYRLAKQLNK